MKDQVEDARRGGICKKAKSDKRKYLELEEKMKSMGHCRGEKALKMKWQYLSDIWKQIHDWEAAKLSGRSSYWAMTDCKGSERFANRLPKDFDRGLYDLMTSFLIDRCPEPDAVWDSALPEDQGKETDTVDIDDLGDNVSSKQDKDKARSTFKKRRTLTHTAGLSAVLEKSVEAMNTMAGKMMTGAMEAMKASAEIGADAMKEASKQAETTRGESMDRMGEKAKEASCRKFEARPPNHATGNLPEVDLRPFL